LSSHKNYGSRGEEYRRSVQLVQISETPHWSAQEKFATSLSTEQSRIQIGTKDAGRDGIYATPNSAHSVANECRRGATAALLVL
jgi:hypothetical protein